MPRQTDLKPIDVVVGVLVDDRDQVLIQQRSDGPFSGLWELPGGKIEAPETAAQALRRELHEELGITVAHAGPLIRITHRYPDRIVTLNTYVVSRYHGRARGMEGQPIKWVARARLFDEPMLPADRPLTMAINLPDRYLVTPDPGATGRDEEALIASLRSSLAAGLELVCLRCPSYAGKDYERLAGRVGALCREAGARLMLHGDAQRVGLARRIGAAGLHLPASALADLAGRPDTDGLWLAASARNARDLEEAERIDADFAVLGAVRAGDQHARGAALGWEVLASLVRSAAMPVYATGGLLSDDVVRARESGSQGVAAGHALVQPSV